MWNPVNNGINYLSTGAGFLPSTVSWDLKPWSIANLTSCGSLPQDPQLKSDWTWPLYLQVVRTQGLSQVFYRRSPKKGAYMWIKGVFLRFSVSRWPRITEEKKMQCPRTSDTLMLTRVSSPWTTLWRKSSCGSYRKEHGEECRISFIPIPKMLPTMQALMRSNNQAMSNFQKLKMAQHSQTFFVVGTLHWSRYIWKHIPRLPTCISKRSTLSVPKI